MCVDESPRHNPHRRRHDVGPVEVVGLEPVDTVTVTTVMDNGERACWLRPAASADAIRTALDRTVRLAVGA